MDQKTGGSDTRGAYSPVTIEEKQPEQSCVASLPWKKIAIGIVIVVALVIISGVVIAIVTKSPKNATMATMGPKTEQTTVGSTPTTIAMTTTPAPDVPGSFDGTITLETTYDQNSYDNRYSPEFSKLVNNFTTAMDKFYEGAGSPITELYTDSTVQMLGSNGTNRYTDVNFKVIVTAVNRGARDHLVNALEPLPSTRLKTFPILWYSINPETTGLDAGAP